MKTRFVLDRLKAIGQTPEWLAEQCGVKAITMNRHYLRGVTPSKSVLMLMALALKVKADDLVYPDEASEEAAVAGKVASGQ